MAIDLSDWEQQAGLFDHMRELVFARILTPLEHLLAVALVKLRIAGVNPTDDDIVECARVGSARTARRMRVQLQVQGVLSWTQDRKQHGVRWVQGANIYQLTVPEAPASAGQRVRPRRSERKKEAWQEARWITPVLPPASLPADMHEKQQARMQAHILARRQGRLKLGV